jgi:solute carrier family 66 (lysosomal lysine-arginine transporter), member 1
MIASALHLLTSHLAAGESETPLTAHEAISGVLGSISLCCWIFLLLPQLIENYRNGSAEAVSLAFILVWFLGDICNLAGALWAGLVSVIVAIGVYFCISDGVLLSQCLYYGIRNRRRQAKIMLARERGASVTGGQSAVVRDAEAARDTETAPLLKDARKRSGSYTGTIPGSEERRRSSQASRGSARRRSSAAAQEARNESLAKILEETDETGTRLWAKNVLSVLGICVIGAAGWAIAYGTGTWKPAPPPGKVHAEELATGAQTLGYASAVLYLGARLPQIYKNWQEKSCEGESHSTLRSDRQLMHRRLVAVVLHSLAFRKPDIRRRYHLPFDPERIYRQKCSMADWKSGNDVRRCHHIRTVPYVPTRHAELGVSH